MVQEIIVPASEPVKKVENFLRNRFPVGYVRKLFRKNGIRVNGKRSKPGELIHPRDRIQLYIPYEKKFTGIAPERPSQPGLPVIFEDQDLLIVDKPPGIAVHEGKQTLRHRSLLGVLEAKYRAAGVVPKLAHRLDKETSGILLVAKNEQVAQDLENAFADGSIRKEYLCLVVGRLQAIDGTIDFPLTGRDGKPVSAVTHFRVLKRFSQSTLLRVGLETGRMHQIRLHCARLGHPVVMDNRHGDFTFNRQFRKAYGLKRQFLHAASLTLRYKGRTEKWTAPLPADLQQVLTSLEGGEQG